MDLERTKHIAKRIVRVFETGRADGRYDACAILADGAGISYGIEQGTDKAGTLDAILLRYCDMGGESKPFVIEALRRLAANETARVDPKHPPEWCRALMALLRDLGKRDPIMARAQEEVFDELYWLPVQSQCIRMRLEQPLSWAIVYDTAIHSGVGGIAANRNRFPEPPPSGGGDERTWAAQYVEARGNWLSKHANPLVQRTCYRTQAFTALIASGNWSLQSPVTIRGVSVA